jgi:hypothetical protein
MEWVGDGVERDGVGGTPREGDRPSADLYL